MLLLCRNFFEFLISPVSIILGKGVSQRESELGLASPAVAISFSVQTQVFLTFLLVKFIKCVVSMIRISELTITNPDIIFTAIRISRPHRITQWPYASRKTEQMGTKGVCPRTNRSSSWYILWNWDADYHTQVLKIRHNSSIHPKSNWN